MSAAAAGRERGVISSPPFRKVVFELAVDVEGAARGRTRWRDAHRAGGLPPLLVLHDEHEVSGAALLSTSSSVAWFLQAWWSGQCLLLVDADVPRDRRRDLSKRKRAVARPPVAREEVEVVMTEEGVGGIIKGVVVVAEREQEVAGSAHGPQRTLNTSSFRNSHEQTRGWECPWPSPRLRKSGTSSTRHFSAVARRRGIHTRRRARPPSPV